MKKIFLLVILFNAFNAWSLCHVSFDVENITPENCPALGAGSTEISRTVLKNSLGRIYHSRLTQSESGSCKKFAELIKAICKPSVQINSYWSEAGSSKLNSMSVSIDAKDSRVASPVVGVEVPTQLPPSLFSNDCQQIGKEAITLTQKCTSIHRCELNTFNTYSAPGGISLKTENGVLVARDSQGNIVEPVQIKKGQLKTYSINGTCSSDMFSSWSEYYDKVYVVAPNGGANLRIAKPVPFCESGSASCLKYNIPLLKQNSQDLLNIVSKKTRVAKAQDVGFCAPTTMGMLMIGLQNQSGSNFGDSIDAVMADPNTGENQFIDPLDGTVAQNWSGAVFRAGQLMGTDWWVGGTEADQNGALLKGNLGMAAGTVDDFMGTKNGYNNANLVEFFNKYGGMVQVSLGHDVTTTGKEGVYHSMLIAGHANNHLNVSDPWGKTYLADMAIQPQSSVYFRVESKLLTYADSTGKNFKFNYLASGQIRTGSLSFAVAPKVGDLFPAWWWNNIALQNSMNQLAALGALTKVTKTGQSVPSISHIDSQYTCNPGQIDADFLSCSPSQRAYLIPGTEVAAVNPGKGMFFDAAESQNIGDMLYGIGQRARGISYANNLGQLNDQAYLLAQNAVRSNGGWIGSITKNTISSAQTECAVSMTKINGVCQSICPTGMTEQEGNLGLPCKGSHTCWSQKSSGLVSGAVSATEYKQAGWYSQCMNGQAQLSEGCQLGTTKMTLSQTGPCGNSVVCARRKSDLAIQNTVDGATYGLPDWQIQCETNLAALKPSRNEIMKKILPIISILLEE